MNGPLAQIVALTCHANAFLQGMGSTVFFPENSTCNFCDSITFVRQDRSFTGKIREVQIAPSPDAWFGHLEGTGAKGVRLKMTPQNTGNTPDRMLAGSIGGGGQWTMEALYPNADSAFWEARWEVWNSKAPDKRIWRVAYLEVSSGPTEEMKPHDLKEIKDRLVLSLQNIRTFSSEHGFDGFTRSFSDALSTLTGNGSLQDIYYKDVAPEGFLSPEAQALLEACQRSWVFGGMGSWNDMAFKGDEQVEYETISERHFQALIASILAAANSKRLSLSPSPAGGR